MKPEKREKFKAVTFSFDDGVTQDVRLVELFNKYGLRCTFNLNSARLCEDGELVRTSITGETVSVRHDKVRKEDVKSIYDGHEVASHTLTHPFLPHIADDDEIVRQTEEDRLRLSDLVGYEVVGFAYPGGTVNFDNRTAELIRTKTGIRYARTTLSSGGFDIAEGNRLFTLLPTAYHRDFPQLYELADRFLSYDGDCPMLFYIWGHSYELDIDGTWERFEEFLKYISGRSGVFYGTNRECLAISE
ncbi:MAG: polysaccharide deacetylase family protein [Oscillospiraceae bacterium]|nr:polysaccharide deacetylase family protein [Oscillospiraceae bacterium]